MCSCEQMSHRSLILSRVFLISLILFFTSVWFFLIFSKSLLKNSNFLLCSSNLLPSSLNIFKVINFTSLSGRLPVSTLPSSFYGIFSCSFGRYFSVFSFCLICWFYFYVFGRFVLFSDLGEVVFHRRCLMYPSSTLTSYHQSSVLLGWPLCGPHASFYCVCVTCLVVSNSMQPHRL